MVAEAGLLVFSTVGGVPELHMKVAEMKERKKGCKRDEYYPDTRKWEQTIIYPDIAGHDDVVVVGPVVIGDEVIGDEEDDDDDGKTQDPVPVEKSVFRKVR